MASFVLPLNPLSALVGNLSAGAGFSFRTGRPRADRIGFVDARAKQEPASDEALMLAYLDGNRASFAELVERYRMELHQFLFRFLGSSAAADDVFQETFLQIHQSARTFDPQRRFKPWLFTIAANKARDWHRRHRRRGSISLDSPLGEDGESLPLVDTLSGSDPLPSRPLEQSEEADLVKEVVDALPAHFREILLLSYFQRLSYNQIADSLRIPLGTVKSRLHSAVATFAERWRQARMDQEDGPRPDLPGGSLEREP